jgi:mono/diheme cytochrome c family protein
LAGLFEQDKLPTSGQEVTEANVKSQLVDPYKNMPSFEDRLTDQQMDEIISYLKSL